MTLFLAWLFWRQLRLMPSWLAQPPALLLEAQMATLLTGHLALPLLQLALPLPLPLLGPVPLPLPLPLLGHLALPLLQLALPLRQPLLGPVPPRSGNGRNGPS